METLHHSKLHQVFFIFYSIRGCPKKMSAVRRGLSGADKGGGIFQMRTSARFGTKIFGIHGVSAWTRGERVHFSRFWADVFYGRPLISYHKMRRDD